MGAPERSGPKRLADARGLLAAHEAALEADLQSAYATDLRDLWRPGGGTSRLTYRRLLVLADGLPPESRLKTEIRDGLSAEDWERVPRSTGHGAWSHSDYLLAAVHDQIGWLIWVTTAVNSEKGKLPKEPKPYPRPGVTVAPGGDVDGVSRDRMLQTAARLHYMRANAGQVPPGGWDWRAYLDENSDGD